MYENGKWIDLIIESVKKEFCKQSAKKSPPVYWMEIPELPSGEKWGLAKRPIDKQ